MTPSMKTLLGAAGAVSAMMVAPAWAVDWAGVPGKDVTLFYPGQSSWEWVMTATDHSGATKFKGGKNCFECHNGDEKDFGTELSSGKKNEPTPIAGKPGSIVANVKVAHDADKMYVHLEFAEGTQPDAKMDAKYATKVTVMLSDGKAANANRAGCWIACHEDSTKMAGGADATRTKYLGASRAKQSRQGSGDELKPAADLAKMKADGQYLEYWQALLNPGAPAVASAFTVLDKREDATPNAVAAEASFANGKWSVTLSRKLKAGAPYQDIVAGAPFTIGFAVHSGHASGRFHYLSFERTLAVDSGTAEFIAK